MRQLPSQIITYRCARCGADKPAIQFQPTAQDGILVRVDSCADCCREIARIRRELGGWFKQDMRFTLTTFAVNQYAGGNTGGRYG